MDKDDLTCTKETLVLFCVDGLEYSSRAFNWYHKHFYRDNQTLGLVQIYVMNDDGDHEKRKQEAKQRSRTMVSQFEEFCTRKKINTKVFIEEKNDSIGHTICKLAKEHGAECIVMGNRGLGAVKRAIFGSVSDYVLHHAHVAVLVVPGPDAVSGEPRKVSFPQ